MTFFERDPKTCPHRDDTKTGSNETIARCNLLRSVLGQQRDATDEASHVDVIDASVCNECCCWFEPSNDEWNPVLASIVFDRAERANNDERATELRRRAASVIPVTDSDPNPYLPSEAAPPDIDQVGDIEAILPGPAPLRDGRAESGPEMSWMVGITTAPRERPTLRYCLESLACGGWEKAFVFGDGIGDPAEVNSADRIEVGWVSRAQNVGGWSNFVLSAHELVHRDPDADAYMMLQDDALVARFSAVKPYLEKIIRSLGRHALLSLYCCELDTRPIHGWHRNPNDFQRGAQAFVFGRDAMRLFVSDPVCRPWEIPWHNQSARPLEQRGVDGNVGRWAHQRGIPLWLPTPSLVWHLGVTSTLWPGAQMTGIWRAGDFLERHA